MAYSREARGFTPTPLLGLDRLPSHLYLLPITLALVNLPGMKPEQQNYHLNVLKTPLWLVAPTREWQLSEPSHKQSERYSRTEYTASRVQEDSLGAVERTRYLFYPKEAVLTYSTLQDPYALSQVNNHREYLWPIGPKLWDNFDQNCMYHLPP